MGPYLLLLLQMMIRLKTCASCGRDSWQYDSLLFPLVCRYLRCVHNLHYLRLVLSWIHASSCCRWKSALVVEETAGNDIRVKKNLARLIVFPIRLSLVANSRFSTLQSFFFLGGGSCYNALHEYVIYLSHFQRQGVSFSGEASAADVSTQGNFSVFDL